jgi:ribosomal protein L11 methyltransferase
LEIGARLLIKPTWSRRRRKLAQAVVLLDPGMSFGTGHHPTTSFCLRELVRFRKPAQKQSFLDVGTGSGILAISAAKLDYRPVHAIDVERDSIQVARANARLNRVLKHIRFKNQDLTRISPLRAGGSSLVCANLTSDLLLAECDRLVAELEPGGLLVLAGILKSEFSKVRRACEKRGLRLRRSRAEREWRSASFSR